MKKRLATALVMGTFFTMAMTGSAQASDFWDLVSSTPSANFGAASIYDINTILNRATITAAWVDTGTNGGLPGIFDGVEQLSGSLDIFDRNGALVIQSPVNLTRAELDAWAAANAEVIFKALFPMGISELTGATDDNILTGTTVSKNLFKKSVPARKNRDNAAAARNEEAQADAEYQDLKVNDFHGRATSLVMGFSKEADSGSSFSLTIPYRYTVINDDVGAESRFLGLEIAAKFPVKKWDQSEWNLGGCLFGSAYTMTTDTLDKAGNLKYGGGAFTSVNRDLGPANLALGLDYRIAKAYMPSSMNGDSLFFDQAADYVNHHSPVQTFSYGFNLGLPVGGDAATINFEVVRSNFVSHDIPDGQKAKTSVGLSGSYYPSDTFELNLGLSRDFELEKVDSFGVMLGVINRF